LPPWARARIIEKYHFKEGEIDTIGQFKWSAEPKSVDGGRLMAPMHDFEGDFFGYVARSLNPEDQPKSLHYLSGVDKAGICWYGEKHSPVVVAVEDQFSAVRLAGMGLRAASLSGTYLDYARIQELVKFGNEEGEPRVYIALDKDATVKAAEYVKKYGWVGDVRLLPLDKDVKDLTRSELGQLILERIFGTETTSSLP
jgi:DNA primase